MCYNMPPGVHVWDIPGYDDGDPAPPLKCCRCGRFLPKAFERKEYVEDGLDCDGTVVTYQEPYSDGEVAILGDEFAGVTYPVSIAACGEHGAHAPHREIFFAADQFIRICRSCKTENVEVV